MTGQLVAERRRPSSARTGPWAAVALLAVGSFAIGTSTFVLAGILPAIAADLGVGVGAAGLAVTAYALASALGTPVLSAVLGRRSPRPVLMAAMATYAVFSVGAAVAPALPVLLALRVGAALSAGVYLAAAADAAVRAVPSNRRGRALAVVLGGSSVATVVGAPLGVLLAGATSWRMAFVLVAALALLPLVGLPLTRWSAGEVPAAGVRGRVAPLRGPGVKGVLGVTFLATTGSTALFTFLGPLVGPTGVPGGVGLVIAVYGIGGALGTAAGGMAADRWGGARTVLVALCVATALFGVTPLALAHPGTALAHALLWGIVTWGCLPAQQHRLIALRPAAGPLVISLNSSAMNLGFAAGSLIGAAVVDHAGADVLWVVAVLSCGAGLVLHAFLVNGGRNAA